MIIHYSVSYSTSRLSRPVRVKVEAFCSLLLSCVKFHINICSFYVFLFLCSHFLCCVCSFLMCLYFLNCYCCLVRIDMNTTTDWDLHNVFHRRVHIRVNSGTGNCRQCWYRDGHTYDCTDTHPHLLYTQHTQGHSQTFTLAVLHFPSLPPLPSSPFPSLLSLPYFPLPTFPSLPSP